MCANVLIDDDEDELDEGITDDEGDKSYFDDDEE
jgi:hypothetical protein